MKRTVLLTYLVLGAVAAPESVFASTNLAVQLLELSASDPDWRALPAERYREKEFAEKNAPPPNEEELKEQERAQAARLIRDAKWVRLHDEYDFLLNRGFSG